MEPKPPYEIELIQKRKQAYLNAIIKADVLILKTTNKLINLKTKQS
jgi:hypothetical protein